MNTSEFILKNLIMNEEYFKKVIVYTKEEYFEIDEERKIVKLLKYVYDNKKTTNFSVSVIRVYFNDKVKKITEDCLKRINEKLDVLRACENENKDSLEHLLDITETFFKERSLYNALSIGIQQFTEKKDLEKIPGLIDKSLQISFKNVNIGKIYGEDSQQQFDYYHDALVRVPTHLENLNKLLGGGFVKKTLNVVLGQPGIGKSRLMTDLSAYFIQKGLNILYVTLELAENEIYRRLDANLLNENINSFNNIGNFYFDKVEQVRELLKGKLIIKEYPSRSINIHVIENLMDEIRRKRNINIDILIIDYLTAMKSVTDNNRGGGNNLYENGKALAEESRYLAGKYDMIVLTALHLGRLAWHNIEANLSHIAESAAIAHTSDLMVAAIATDEMIKNKRLMLKVMKNRLFSVSETQKALIGFDDSRMRHFDIEEDIEDVVRENSNDEFFDF